MSNQNNQNIFSLTDVSKTFKLPLTNPLKPRKTVKALDSVTLEILRGKVTCLLGPNGAGKTTLIKILADLITPDSGEILYRDMVLDESGKKVQGKIGLVTPNDRSFYWRLTGRQNLEFFGALYNLRGAALRRRIEESLDEVGMTNNADKSYQLYSAGMKQKLNIARALLGHPELYLLDEPASHLDPLAREEFWHFVLNILMKKRNATVFLCTHDLEEARLLADQIVILDAGRVVAQGTPKQLNGVIDNRKELELHYSGEIPRGWPDRGDLTVDRGENGTLRVLFDEAVTTQEAVIRSFVEAGGNLREVFVRTESLLELLHRKAGRNV